MNNPNFKGNLNEKKPDIFLIVALQEISGLAEIFCYDIILPPC